MGVIGMSGRGRTGGVITRLGGSTWPLPYKVCGWVSRKI